MAGSRTVQFIVAADASQFQRVLQQVESSGGKLAQTQQVMGQKVDATTQKLQRHGEVGHRAFSLIGTAMSATGQQFGPITDGFNQLEGVFTQLDRSGGRIRRTFQGVGAAGLAAGALITAASATEQRNQVDLQNAVENTGRSWDDYKGQLDSAAKSMAQFGHTEASALDALATLTTATHDPEKAMKDLGAAADIAARQHIPLTDAAQRLSLAMLGSSRSLRRLGIDTHTLVDTTKEETKAAKDQESAHKALQTATQHLSDVEARVAAARQANVDAYQARLSAAQQSEESANQRVTDSTTRLADARRNLVDVEAKVHDATTLTIDDLHQLRDANQSVEDVNAQIASGELTGQQAFIARRDAEQRLADVQEANRRKQQVTLAQQKELRSAHEQVTKALIAENRAREKQAEAHAKTQAVQKAGPSPISLALQQEEAQAKRNFAAAQDRATKADAERKKADDDMRRLGSTADQVVALVEKNFGGAAQAQSKTLSGMVHRWVAEADNAFAAVGTKAGTAIIAISTGILAIAELAPVLGAAFSAAFGPVGLIIAAIALLAFGIYELYKHWDAVWGFIKRISLDAYHFLIGHWKEIVAFLAGGLGVYELYKHWHSVWGAIRGVVQGVVNFMIDAFNGLTKIVLSPINLLIDAVNLVIGAIDHIHFKAPSWLGGWTFGINIPKIPHLDFSVGHVSFAGSGGTHSEGPIIHGLGGAGSTGGGGLGGGRIRGFATGGIVPGPVGAAQLAVVHGGEKVIPYWRGGASGGDGVSIGQLVVQVTAPTLDRQTAYKVGEQVAEGVHQALLRKKRSGNPTLGLA